MTPGLRFRMLVICRRIDLFFDNVKKYNALLSLKTLIKNRD